MLLRLTLHSVPLFKRYAPYASRLSAKSKHFVVLAFCFKKKGEGESPRKAFVTKCSPADANFVPLYFVYFRFFA